MTRLMLAVIGGLVWMLAQTALAQQAALKNWFDDLFFQVSDGIPKCPQPLGPLMTEPEMRSESHSRIERGTSCWLAGKCTEPNAYRYDAAIAKAIRDRFATSRLFKNTSLWITVKRRFVWVEGCVANPGEKALLEAFMQSVPNVERVLFNVASSLEEKLPYPALENSKAAQ